MSCHTRGGLIIRWRPNSYSGEINKFHLFNKCNMTINRHLFLIHWQYQYTVGIYSCVLVRTDITIIQRMRILKMCLLWIYMHPLFCFRLSKTSRCACYYKIFYQFLPLIQLILLYGRQATCLDNVWAFSGSRVLTYLLTYSMERSPSWEADQSLQLVKKIPRIFMEPESSLQYSQVPAVHIIWYVPLKAICVFFLKCVL
jgi:hypothetical protein